MFLYIFHLDRRVSVELEQDSQASSCDEVGSLLASRFVHRVTGHLSCCIWNLRLFLDDATGVSVPLHAVTSFSGLHSKRCRASGPFFSGWGIRCLSECGTAHEASSRVSV